MFFTSDLLADVKKILQNFEQRKLKLAAAESCTGGLLSGLFTEITGSSKIFDRGFVVYSNQAKIEMLGVEEKTLEKFGAVSEEVAREMASGAIKNSQADVSVAITGIAGPDGGSTGSPYLGGFERKENDLNGRFQREGRRVSATMGVGESEEKPVGLVYIAVATKEKISLRKFNFSGDRSEVRKSTLIAALAMLDLSTQTQ